VHRIGAECTLAEGKIVGAADEIEVGLHLLQLGSYFEPLGLPLLALIESTFTWEDLPGRNSYMVCF